MGVEVDNHQGRQQGQHLEDDEDDARLGRQWTPLAQVGLRCTRAFAAAASCCSHALYQENFYVLKTINTMTLFVILGMIGWMLGGSWTKAK